MTKQQAKLAAAAADAKKFAKLVGWKYETLAAAKANTGVESNAATVRMLGIYVLFKLGHSEYAAAHGFQRASSEYARKKILEMFKDPRNRATVDGLLAKMRQPKAA